VLGKEFHQLAALFGLAQKLALHALGGDRCAGMDECLVHSGNFVPQAVKVGVQCPRILLAADGTSVTPVPPFGFDSSPRGRLGTLSVYVR